MRIALCDDDPEFLNTERRLLQSIGRNLNIFMLIEGFENPEELISAFDTNQYAFDLVLLNIGMPEMDGRLCAEKLRSKSKDFKLVFVTAQEREVYHLFQYHISGFIPKAMPEEFMERELMRILAEAASEKKKWLLFETISDLKLKIQTDDIMYFDIAEKRIRLHTENNIYVLKRTHFDSLKELMRDYHFAPIHRACIVNTERIVSIEGSNLQLENGEILCISRRLLKAANQAFADSTKAELMKHNLSGLFV